MSQQYKRIAVKIGSNVLTRKDGALDVTRMSALVDQIAELRENGIEVILISSGAVASGRGELKEAVSRKMDSVDQRQLFSAEAGQAHQPLLRTVPRAPLAGGAGADDEREFQYAPPLPEPTELYDGDVGKRGYSDCERE